MKFEEIDEDLLTNYWRQRRLSIWAELATKGEAHGSLDNFIKQINDDPDGQALLDQFMQVEREMQHEYVTAVQALAEIIGEGKPLEIMREMIIKAGSHDKARKKFLRIQDAVEELFEAIDDGFKG